MKKTIFILLTLFVLGLLMETSAQIMKADYQFQGNYLSSVPGAPGLSELGHNGQVNSFVSDTVDGYTRQTLRFPFNNGVGLNTAGLIPPNAYTIVGLFRFDQVTGRRRVAGSDPTDNFGAYIVDGRLEFESTANAQFFPNTYIQVVVVREANGTVRAYRDGGLRVNVQDTDGDFIIDGFLRFFQDDINLPTEASAGNLARLRLYDAPMTTAQVRNLDRLPNTGGGEQPILFWSQRDGFAELYTMNADGSNQKRLTFSEIHKTLAKWSPDRTKIVFIRREVSPAVNQIWVMNADGSGQTRLTNTTGHDQYPSWHPDSTKILFSRCTTAGVCDLYTMNADGSNQTPIPNVNTTGDEDQAIYSPNGAKIIFFCATETFANANICEANADGTGRIQLTNTVSPVYNDRPTYSPNGAKIAFRRVADSTNSFTGDIFVMNSNGTNLVNLTANSNIFDSDPIWSPDGARLAFSSQRESVFVETYTMNSSDGGSIQRLTVNSVGDVPLDWYRPLTVVAPRRAPFDFDGDDKTDLSIFRPSNGQWWINRSSNNSTVAVTFGSSSDKIVPADYTGDQKADNAVFRPSEGNWYFLRSEDFSFYAFPFGNSTDTPVPADYDGDQKADAAVFRPSTNTWFIQKSSGGTDIITFGTAGDKPVVGDYDGDGKADIAIYRPSAGQWWIRRSSDTSVFAVTFGISTDKPVQGFYTADNKTDVAIWRPSTGEWFILRSEDFSFYSFAFGVSTDTPVPGDYDGDDRFDAGVFRPSESTWYIQRTTAGTLIQQFGTTGDLPIPNAFVP